MTLSYDRKPGLVSVVIATYNYGRFIIDALNGIKNQTYKDIEVIVMDDASEDNTQKLIENWLERYEERFQSFIYIKLPRNCGAGWAYNIGFQVAQGEYIVIHDSDDIEHPSKIGKQVNLLENHPDTAMVGTGYRTFKDNILQSKAASNWLSFSPERIEKNYKTHFRHCVAYATLMFRAAILDEVIGCFKAIPVGNDMFFVNNIVNHDFVVENIKEELFFYRHHEGQMSSQIRSQQHEKTEIPVLKKRSIIDNLVSVVLPVKNSKKTIFEALKSIEAQTYPQIELIVSDDASSDDTEGLVKDWYKHYIESQGPHNIKEMVYFKLPRKIGSPWILNVGPYLSRGEFIAFHNDKGISDPERIKKQVDFLKGNFMYSAVGTNCKYSSLTLKYDEELEHSYISNYMHCLNINTLMVRYDVIHKTAGFNNSIQGASDFEFIYRLLNNGYRVQNLKDVLYMERS